MKVRAGASMVAAGVIGIGSIGVAGVGVGWAAAHGGVIHGCVAKSGGALRIVKHTSSCTSHEKPLSFNKQGPRGAPGTAARPGTFQMFANVDAEGDLGSNFDATAATKIEDGQYIVTFSQDIGHCAAVAQPGKAGGPDPVPPATTIAQPVPSGSGDPNHQLFIETLSPSTGAGIASPFMLTLTCETSP